MDKKTILVIDDDPEILKLCTTVLEEKNYTVKTALSGREGVDMFDSVKPDLVLCDLMMESIDQGVKVAREIREQDTSIPMYLLSSVAEDMSKNISIHELGFNGILQKPISSDELLLHVNRALRGS